MTEPEAQTHAALLRRLLDSEARAALAAVSCRADCVELLAPEIERRLHIDATTGAVAVLDDEDAQPRPGVTPAMLAQEVRAKYEARHPKRFFS